MKPSFQTLKSNYYSSDEFSSSYVSASDLYAEVGIDHQALLRENPAYINTCAARVSLALIKSGVTFNGRLAIKSGDYKGKKLETGAKLLADQLMKPTVFGYPKLYTPKNFLSNIAGKKGVVFFWKMVGYNGGHIDLIDGSNNQTVCSSACYLDSKEIWFWPLQ